MNTNTLCAPVMPSIPLARVVDWIVAYRNANACTLREAKAAHDRLTGNSPEQIAARFANIRESVRRVAELETLLSDVLDHWDPLEIPEALEKRIRLALATRQGVPTGKLAGLEPSEDGG